MKIFKIFNIEIVVDILFLIMLLSFLLSNTLLPAFILYTSVLLHELGHGLTAKYFGYSVPRIVLHPFGGIAHINHHTKIDPFHMSFISIMGPIVNIILAIIAILFMYILGPLYLLDILFTSNIIMCIFNLIPVLPLDGGQIVLSICELLNFNIKNVRKFLIFGGLVLGAFLIGIGAYYGLIITIMIGIFLCLHNTGERNEYIKSNS